MIAEKLTVTQNYQTNSLKIRNVKFVCEVRRLPEPHRQTRMDTF